jgi:integrase/recombinase XerD
MISDIRAPCRDRTSDLLITSQRRPKKDGLFPVKVRVTYLRRQRYFKVGVDLTQEDFDRISNHTVRRDLRPAKEKILNLETRIKNEIDSLREFSFEDLDLALNKNKKAATSNKVYDLFDEVISKLNSEERFSTALAYKDARNSLDGYKANLKFKQITVQFLKDYEKWMKEEGKTISTIGIYLRHLRAIFNRAIEREIITQKYYPFGKNRYQIKAPRNIKKALTIEQISQIINYDVIEGSNQHFARDIWLFSYLCNGMNIKDIVSLKFKNLIGDSIQYDRSKTSNTIQNPKPIVITLLPKTQEILERWAVEKKKEEDYIFPVLKKGISELQKKKDKDQFIKTINKYMKVIGKEIGYDKPLTTYAARHSFATVLKRSGAPTEFISESLGHKSLHTTEAYLDSLEDSSRKKFMDNLIPK